jgi:hypothetical protein
MQIRGAAVGLGGGEFLELKIVGAQRALDDATEWVGVFAIVETKSHFV